MIECNFSRRACVLGEVRDTDWIVFALYTAGIMGALMVIAIFR